MSKYRTNPETEWHRRSLGKDRRAQRQGGVAFFILGIVLLPAGAAFAAWMYPHLVARFSLWDTLGFFLTFLGGPVAFLLLGITQYLDGRQPVSDEEIERRRQRERNELFRMAQGKLPFRYSYISLGLFAFFGLFCLVPGVLVLSSGTSYHTGGWVLVQPTMISFQAWHPS
jgi:hypothetical protein